MDATGSLQAFHTAPDDRIARRLDYAAALAARGETGAAIDMIAQTIDLCPHWPPIYFQLGLYHQDAQNRDAAITAFTDYLKRDAQDYMGATIKLTLLGAMKKLEQLPPGYVTALFDEYAPRFDSALIENLSYCVPQRLYALVNEVRPADDNAERILDLGCGTGLAGERFARRAAALDGVDLSSGMVAQAQAKQLYTNLAVADLGAYLQTPPPAPYDLVLAADVFVYLGALDKILPAVAGWMAPGALFAFSVQAAPGEGYILGADHRFAHSRPYLERQLAAAGLAVLRFTPETLRQDGGQDVQGYLVVCTRPAPVLATAALGTGFATPHEADGAAGENHGTSPENRLN